VNGGQAQCRDGTSILWQRFDVPGHDAAVLELEAAGPAIRGMAVFQDEAGPSALSYTVRCNHDWITTGGEIQGWTASRSVEVLVRRTGRGDWTLNGAACPDVAGCVDLDLSFTPATNLLPLRRSALEVGGEMEVRSAWLEWPVIALKPLVQRYRRDTDAEYLYEADIPDEPFTGVLRVAPSGWVLEYSGLWRAQPGT
jgi:hypothetical protein